MLDLYKCMLQSQHVLMCILDQSAWMHAVQYIYLPIYAHRCIYTHRTDHADHTCKSHIHKVHKHTDTYTHTYLWSIVPIVCMYAKTYIHIYTEDSMHFRSPAICLDSVSSFVMSLLRRLLQCEMCCDVTFVSFIAMWDVLWRHFCVVYCHVKCVVTSLLCRLFFWLVLTVRFTEFGLCKLVVTFWSLLFLCM